MKSGLAIAVPMLLAATSVLADEVYLRGGGRVSGIIAEESAESVEVEIGAGLVSVPRSQVDRIVRASSPLATYQTRARGLAADDVSGWLTLASWAQRMDLSTQARDAYTHVLDVEPGNSVAQRALGNRLVGDRWLSHDEAMQAQGYVRVDGEWMMPEERDALLEERAAARREGLELARSRAAVAEAEAHAREAEARAHVAEVEAQRAAGEAEAPPVFVWPGIYGYSGYGGRTHHHGDRHHEGENSESPSNPTPQPKPSPTTPPAHLRPMNGAARGVPSRDGMSISGHRVEYRLDERP
jgi:hypothetical protein